MRHNARIDMNQPSIVAELRAHGCCTQSLAALGCGVPDILCWSPHVGGDGLVLIEVKNPDMPPSDRKLTKDQQRFHDFWPGPIHIVETNEQALVAVGARKE